MNELQVVCLVTAAVASLPSWLTASILKRHARQAGEQPSDWIPLSVLPFAFARFKHPQKGAIVFGYLASNLLFVAGVVGFLLARKT